ncbi:MAG: IS1 family transposase [Anaerolineales bacterium]|nr:IS1 family transposase [Anaerolineales bacterium]
MSLCPHCQAIDGQVRAGKNLSGTQRIKCTRCGCRYTPQPAVGRYSGEMRDRAVQLYMSGCSFRKIARCLHINHQTIINWINAYAKQLPRPVARSLSRR